MVNLENKELIFIYIFVACRILINRGRISAESLPQVLRCLMRVSAAVGAPANSSVSLAGNSA